jgi:hypothetical protein
MQAIVDLMRSAARRGKGQKKEPAPSYRRLEVDLLECRIAPAVSSFFNPATGLLSVSSAIGDPIAVQIVSGNVKVNSVNPVGGLAAVALVKNLTISAPGNNSINLSQLVTGALPNFVSGKVTGGAGDTLIAPAGPAQTNVWFLTGTNKGVLNGTLVNPLTPTITGGISFTGIPNLTGGSHSDTFAYFNTAVVTGAITQRGTGDLTLLGKTITLPGPVATQGGTLTINSAASLTTGSSVTFKNKVSTQGGNLTVFGDTIALDTTIRAVTLTSRKLAAGANPATAASLGDSGNMALNGRTITIGSAVNSHGSANLYAQVQNGSLFGPGKIDITAQLIAGAGTGSGFTFPLLPSVDISTASIDVYAAKVLGGDVTFTADAQSVHVNTAPPGPGDPPVAIQTGIEFLQNFQLIAGVAVSTSNAAINLGASSLIVANSFTATSSATSDAETAPIAVKLGVAVAVANTSATLNAAGKIQTKNDTFLQTNAFNTLLAWADAGGNLAGAGAAIAVAVENSTSNCIVTPSGVINSGGDLTVQANTVNSKALIARTTTGNDGQVGIAAAVAYVHDVTNAQMDGKATVSGDVTIQATETKSGVFTAKFFVFPTTFAGVTSAAGVGNNDSGDLLINLQGATTTAVLDKLKTLVTKKSNNQQQPGQQSQGQAPKFEAGAAFSVDVEDNFATARVGPGAILKAGGDVTVDAMMNDRPAVVATSDVEAPPNPTGGTADPTKFNGSVAVAIAIYNTTANAYIGANATVDAGGKLAVTSEVYNDYQLAYGINLYQAAIQPPTHTTDEKNGNAVTINHNDIVEVKDGHKAGGTVGNWYRYTPTGSTPNVDLTTEDFTNAARWTDLGAPWQTRAKGVITNLTTYLDGSFGFGTVADSSWSQATTKGSKIGVAGSFTVLDLNEISNATIESGARVNQDTSPTYRTGDQNVLVVATATNSAVNLGGSIETPGLAGSNTEFKASVNKPGFGTIADKGAVGAAFVVILYNDRVAAKINDGVRLYGDSLLVNGETAVGNVNLLTSGAKSDDFGFNGVFSVVHVDNSTIAQISKGAIVTVGNNKVVQTFVVPPFIPNMTTTAIQATALPGTAGVSGLNPTNTIDASTVVVAHDSLLNINIAGGVIAAQNVGVGASVALNLVKRHTEAFIGDSITVAGARPATTTLDSAGAVIVDARNTGTNLALSLAASTVADHPQQNTSQQQQQNPPQGGQTGGQYGVGVSADVSFNDNDESVLAYVHDAVVRAASLQVNAANTTLFVAVAGAVTLVTKPQGTSFGLAGSYSENQLRGPTSAMIDGATVTLTGDLGVHATTTGTIISVAASGSFVTTPTPPGISIAGQVSVNILSTTTQADIANQSSVTAANVEVTATSSNGIYAIAGAISYGSRAGVGASVGVNTIPFAGASHFVRAYIEDSDVTATGTIDVTAVATDVIKSITAALVAAKAGMAGALAISINTISPETQAYIRRKKTQGQGIKGTGNLTVSATDTSTIQAIAGSIGIGTTVVGFGLSFAYNAIGTEVKPGKTEALIESTTVTLTAGTLTAKATATPTIHVLAFAGALAMPDGNGSVQVEAGAAGALNNIASNVTATIDPSTVTATGIDIEATSTATIFGLAIGVGGTLSSTQSAGITFVGAGSGVGNAVNNHVEATIKDGSNVTTTGAGSVTLKATDTSSVTAGAGAAAISLATGQQSGASVAVGVSVAVNTLGSSTNPDTITAGIQNATVNAGGGVTITANSTPSILAVTVAGALGVGTGNAAFAGAGAGSGNSITRKVQALISDGSDVTTHNGQAVTLTATDHATIQADAGGLALGFAGGQDAILGGALGAAISINSVTDTIIASIIGSTVTSAGNVALKATTQKDNGDPGQSILAVSVGVSGAALLGATGGGIAFAGAGSGSGNTIRNTVEASIKNSGSGASKVQSHVTTSGLGDITLTALDGAKITAGAGALTVAFAGGQGNGFGVAVGVSAAANSIGAADQPNSVRAAIEDSTVDAAGGVQLTANSKSTILAITVAGGIGLSGAPTNGVAFGLAGAGSQNVIAVNTQALIADGSTVTTHNGKDVTLTATDRSDITADGGGVGISVAGGGTLTFTVGIGAGYANNRITNNTAAGIDHSTVASAGKVTLSASSPDEKITAVAFGVGVAVSASGSTAIAGAGSGAASYNTIANTIEAYIQNGSTVTAQSTAADAVSLSATDQATIVANSGAGSAALGLAPPTSGVGVAIAAGAVVSNNAIGDTVQAFIGKAPGTGADATTVNAAGGVSLTASSKPTITALGIAVAAAVGTHFAGAGVGANVVNTIGQDTQGFDPAAAVDTNNSTITADSLRGFTPGQALIYHTGGGAAIGALVDGGIYYAIIDAVNPNRIKLAASVADALAGNAIDLTSTGTGSTHTLTAGQPGTTEAAIRNGASVNAHGTGAVLVTAEDKSTITATVGTGALAVGIVGASIGISLTTNTIGSVVNADIAGADVTTTGGDVSVAASANQAIDGKSIATAASISIGGAGAGAVATTLDRTATQAFVGAGSTVSTHGGALNVSATSTPSVAAEADGGTLGILSVGVFRANATLAGATRAFIGEATTVNAGNITVAARNITPKGASSVSANSTLVSIGAVGVSDSQTTATARNITEAYVGPQEGATPGGSAAMLNASGDVKVTADSVTTSSVGVIVGAGGLIASATAAVVTAEVSETTRAYLGDNVVVGSTANPAASLTVTATAADIASATATVGSGGVLTGRGTDPRANLSPTIKAYLGSNVNVNVASDVVVEATSLRAEGHATGKSYGGGGVDVGVPHATTTSKPTVVAYIGGGSKVVAGGNAKVLASALAVPTQVFTDEIQAVTPGADSITFPSHGLVNDEQVVYAPGTSATPIQTPTGPLDPSRNYRVITNGPDTLQLGAIFKASTINAGDPLGLTSGVDPDRNMIRFATPHLFRTGDAVHYNPSGNPTIGAGLNASGTYFVRVLDPLTIKLYATAPEANAPFTSFDPDSQLIGSTFQFLPANFNDGDAVTYLAPAPLIFHSTSFDATVNGDAEDGTRLFVGDTSALVHGQEVVYETNAAPGVIPFSGLVPGGHYFLRVVNATEIQLATSLVRLNHLDVFGKHDQLVQLGADTSTKSAVNATEALRPLGIGGLSSGVTYYVANRDTLNLTFQLRDAQGNLLNSLSSAGANQGLNFIGRDGLAFDNMSNAKGFQDLHLVISSPTTTAPTGDKLLAVDTIGGVHLSLRALNPPAGTGQSSAVALGGSGGLFEFSSPVAVTTLDPTVKASVAATKLQAEGDITIASESIGNLSATANNASGGFVDASSTSATTNFGESGGTSNTSAAFVGAGDPAGSVDATGVHISAGGAFTLASDTQLTTTTTANTDGGGFIKSSVADAISNINSNTLTVVGDGAQIAARSVNLTSTASKLDVTASSRATAYGFVGIATTNSTSNANSSVKTRIGDGPTTINGDQGVDVRALNQNYKPSLTAISISSALFVPFFDGLRSHANSSGSFTTAVDAEAGATVFAGPRPAGTPLVPTFTDFPFLALYVQAQDPGVAAANLAQSRTITWNANVTINSGQDPLLVIDSSGKITTADNVTVSDGTLAGPIVPLGGFITSGTAVVHDISGAQIGQAYFVGDNSVTNSAHNPPYPANHPYPLFTFDYAFRKVTIINHSANALEIHGIDVVSPDLQTGSGRIDVKAVAPNVNVDNIPFNFRIAHAVEPSLVDIENRNALQTPSDITLLETIFNPIGETLIRNFRGDILSNGAGATIWTNTLELAATGDLGAASNRIFVDLIESADPFTGAVRPIAFTAAATTGDVFLDITGRRRHAGAGTFIIPVQSISAGQDIDIVLESSLLDAATTGAIGDIKVAVNDTSKPYFNFFHPDDGVASQTLDRGVFVDPTGTVPIASIYDFQKQFMQVDADNLPSGDPGLTAGGNILVNAARPNPTDPNIDIVGITQLTGAAGFIDTLTNGYIKYTEAGGTPMRIGSVQSTNSNVLLTNPDLASAGQDIDVVVNDLNNGLVSAATTIVFIVGDNFSTFGNNSQTGSLLTAGTSITINIDDPPADPDPGVGSITNIDGLISSPLTLINGNDDDDTINLNYANGINTLPTAVAPDLTTAQVIVDGKGGSNKLKVDDSGDPGADSGYSTLDTVFGLGMGGFGVSYTNIQELEVDLSQGGTTTKNQGGAALSVANFTVYSTHDGTPTLVRGGAGNDIVQVGSTPAGPDLAGLPTQDHGDLNDIRALLTVIGNGGLDYLEINDHANSDGAPATHTNDPAYGYNYLVTPTEVANDPRLVKSVPFNHQSIRPEFAGIIYNNTGTNADSVNFLSLNATDRTNRFAVTPSTLTTYLINAEFPTDSCRRDGGDYLMLDTTQLADRTARRLHIFSDPATTPFSNPPFGDPTFRQDTASGILASPTGNGYWDFVKNGKTYAQRVYFLSIEQFNHVAIVASVTIPPPNSNLTPRVIVKDAETGEIKFTLQPYENFFHGGIYAAVGDLNCDGIPDVATSPQQGHTPIVNIYNGTPNAAGVYLRKLINSFNGFNPITNSRTFLGGMSLAIGDVNFDGHQDLVVGFGPGYVPTVQVFNGETILNARPSLLGKPFFAFNSAFGQAINQNFKGGVNVAVGDLNNDGFAEIVATVASNGPAIVNVFDGNGYAFRRGFYAFNAANIPGGLSAAIGDINGDGVRDIVVGSALGYSPAVAIFSGDLLFRTPVLKPLKTLTVAPPTFRGSIIVQTAPVDGGNPGTVERAGIFAQLFPLVTNGGVATPIYVTITPFNQGGSK